MHSYTSVNRGANTLIRRACCCKCFLHVPRYINNRLCIFRLSSGLHAWFTCCNEHGFLRLEIFPLTTNKINSRLHDARTTSRQTVAEVFSLLTQNHRRCCWKITFDSVFVPFLLNYRICVREGMPYISYILPAPLNVT